MSVELPGEVVQLLQFIGIQWPNINEDGLRDMASHIRRFAADLQETHGAATATVRAVGRYHRGAAYEALSERWGSKSSAHLNELVEGCGIVADALDAGADVVLGMKAAAVAELVALAASFVADQAAAVATLGLAEAAEAAIYAAARKAVEFLEQQVVQYLAGEIIEAALGPLFQKVASAVEGLAYQAVAGAPGGGSAGPPGAMFEVDTVMLRRHAQEMHDHADRIAAHGQAFRDRMAAVSLT